MTDQFKRERDEAAYDKLKERIAQLELQSTNYRDAFETSRTAFDLLKEAAEQFQAERDKLNERVKELEAENARLQEAISYLPKVPTKPYEQELARRIVEAEAERDRWREMAEKMAEALKFYANAENYESNAPNDCYCSKVEIEEGSSARNALSEFERLRDGE